MAEIRPGAREYVTATKVVAHGAPCTENNYVGIALKQIEAPYGTGLDDDLITKVQVDEEFVIAIKGRVYVSNVDAAGGTFTTKGEPVYIIAASNLLTSASGGNLKYGRVAEVAGERGVGTGKMRVDLDAKDGF